MVGIVHAGRNRFRVVYAQKMKRYRQQTAGECCFRFFDLQKIAKRGDEKNLARFFLPKIQNQILFRNQFSPNGVSPNTSRTGNLLQSNVSLTSPSPISPKSENKWKKPFSTFQFWPNREDTSFVNLLFAQKMKSPGRMSSRPAHKNKNDASTGRMGPHSAQTKQTKK